MKSRKKIDGKRGVGMKRMIIEIDLEKSNFDDFTTWAVESVLKRLCRDLKKEDMIGNWQGISFLRDEKGKIVGKVVVKGYKRDDRKEEEDEL
jgi:hypothetical protein